MVGLSIIGTALVLLGVTMVLLLDYPAAAAAAAVAVPGLGFIATSGVVLTAGPRREEIIILSGPFAGETMVYDQESGTIAHQ